MYEVFKVTAGSVKTDSCRHLCYKKTGSYLNKTAFVAWIKQSLSLCLRRYYYIVCYWHTNTDKETVEKAVAFYKSNCKDRAIDA